MPGTQPPLPTEASGKGNICVNVFDTEYNFDLQPASTGRHLFDQVIKLLGIKAVWFFGLSYVDSKGVPAWLKLKLRVFSQDVGKKKPVHFKFRAKYFPEDSQKELVDPGAQKIFFLQVKSAILNEELYCPSDTSVLLASYAIQTKYGDYVKGVHTPGFLSEEKVLPQKVLDQYELTFQEWEDRIVSFYKDYKGLTSTQAMSEYLGVAQDQEMFGITYFDIKNKKGTELRLGVGALGLYVYEPENSLTPKLGFPWEEISSIAFNNKKLTIKAMDDTSPGGEDNHVFTPTTVNMTKTCRSDAVTYLNFAVFVPRVRLNRLILSLAVGNHELYLRRRHASSMFTGGMPGETKGYQKVIDSKKMSNKGDPAVPSTSAQASQQSAPDIQVENPTPTPSQDKEHQELKYKELTSSGEDATGEATLDHVQEAALNGHVEYQWQDSKEEEQASMVFHEETTSGTSSPYDPGSPISPGLGVPPVFPSSISQNSCVTESESSSLVDPGTVPISPPTVKVKPPSEPEVEDEKSDDMEYNVSQNRTQDVQRCEEKEQGFSSKSDIQTFICNDDTKQSMTDGCPGNRIDMSKNDLMPDIDIPETKSFSKDFLRQMTPEEVAQSKAAMERDKHLLGPEQYSKLKLLFEELSQQEKSLTNADRQHRRLLKDGQDKYKTLRNIQQGLTRTRIAVFEAM